MTDAADAKKTVNIWIDGREHRVAADDNLLATVLGLGIDLPYFCWHPALGSIGACRQCAVTQFKDADDDRGRLVMACMTPVSDGARFSVDGGAARHFRQQIIEGLMVNHPHDCPVCAEGGECHLQDMTVMTGHRDRRYRGLKQTHRNQYLGPLINHEMNRCISCYRCTRYYRDYAGGTDLNEQGAHDRLYFGRERDGVLESAFSGNLVEVCPTGVFTDKPLVNDYTRKWDLQSAPSICHGCSVGCNISPGERYGRLKRVHNRFHADINGWFLCDRGRFGADWVNLERRLDYPARREADGRFRAMHGNRALAELAPLCGPERRVAAIGSPRASIESNFVLRQLVGADNFSPGFGGGEQLLVEAAVAALDRRPQGPPSASQMERADAVLLLGEDIGASAPRLALSLRQATRNRAFALAAEAGLAHWQDAAVRNVAQQRRSPMFVVCPGRTALDDVAASTVSLAPPDCARFALAVAAALDASLPAIELPSELGPRVREVADALRSAEHPLVVSGTASGEIALIHAAEQIVAALEKDGRDAALSLSLPECNSAGAALLAGPGAIDLESLLTRARAGEIDTLLVLENDLYRRADSAAIDALLETVETVVVLDVLDTPTADGADRVLPVASFAESGGTLVSMEGRAQRFYPVFPAAAERRAGWQWITALGRELGREDFDALEHLDAIIRAASQIPGLAEICDAAPTSKWRFHSLKIPRQPLRYSGRTAQTADRDVHEPRVPADPDSPLAWSMEGINGGQPGALVPWVWSPGWNSNQSVVRFQDGVGGPMGGHSAGERLLGGKSGAIPPSAIPAPFARGDGQWQLLIRPDVFAGGELSALSPALAERAGVPRLWLHPEDAAALSLKAGNGVRALGDGGEFCAALELDPALPPGLAATGAGTPGLFNGPEPLWVRLEKTAAPQPPQGEIIARERAGD